MRIRSRRGWRFATLVALAWVLGGTGVCEAQLFPNLPIRRKKNDCDQEAPFYKMIRQNYHGYYPTCWRQFPPGWTCPCPNPAAPNWEASKRDIPLQTDEKFLNLLGGPGADGNEEMDEPGAETPPPRRGRGNGPDLPGGRSPFEMDGPVNPPPNLRDRSASVAPPAGQPMRRWTTTPASSTGASSAVLPPINLPETQPAPNGTAVPEALPPLPPGLDDEKVSPTSLAPRPQPAPKRTGLIGSLLRGQSSPRN